MWCNNFSYPQMRCVGLTWSQKTFVKWSWFLRETLLCYYEHRSEKIGGDGHRVQIDESLFGHRKYNRGKMLNEQWVFGGLDETTVRSQNILEKIYHFTITNETQLYLFILGQSFPRNC